MMDQVKHAMYDGLLNVGSQQTFKLGLDIHGVIDADPGFIWLANFLVEHHSEVHILTGTLDTPALRAELEAMSLKYTHLFSVASHHTRIGTKMWYTDPENPWMDAEAWNKSKADYCREHKIHLMVDDSEEYEKHFTTPYIRYRKGAGDGLQNHDT